MPIDTGTTFAELDDAFPLRNDPKNQGDDHIRNFKGTCKTQFPGENGDGLNIPITTTEFEFHTLIGATSNIQQQITDIDKEGLDAAIEANKIQIEINRTSIATGEQIVIDHLARIIVLEEEVARINSSVITGAFNGATLGIIFGGGYTVVPYPGGGTAEYLIQLNEAPTSGFAVVASSPAITLVARDSASSFKIVTSDSNSSPVVVTEIDFIVTK